MTWKWIRWKAVLKKPGNQLMFDCVYDCWYPREQIDSLKMSLNEQSSTMKNEVRQKIKHVIEKQWTSNELEFWTDENWNTFTWVHPAPTKRYDRAIQKLLEDYKCDFNRSTDMSRATLEYPNLEWLIEWMKNVIRSCKDDKNVEQIAIIDKIGPVFEMAEKSTWYRDIKLLIKLTDWNTVELMFHTTQTLEVKQRWVTWEHVKKYLDKLRISFNQNDMKYILDGINEYKLRKDAMFSDNWTSTRKKSDIILNSVDSIFSDKTYLSADMFSYIHRNLPEDDELKQKLQKAETIVWESAREKIMKDMMPNKNYNAKKK